MKWLAFGWARMARSLSFRSSFQGPFQASPRSISVSRNLRPAPPRRRHRGAPHPAHDECRGRQSTLLRLPRHDGLHLCHRAATGPRQGWMEPAGIDRQQPARLRRALRLDIEGEPGGDRVEAANCSAPKETAIRRSPCRAASRPGGWPPRPLPSAGAGGCAWWRAAIGPWSRIVKGECGRDAGAFGDLLHGHIERTVIADRLQRGIHKRLRRTGSIPIFGISLPLDRCHLILIDPSINKKSTAPARFPNRPFPVC